MQDVTKAYDKTREELIKYEDAEFNSLIANVPNFYISRNDQTLWGNFLRNVASELGRLEYYHSYDIVSKNPRFLNPADIKRQWNGPLFINRNYPSPLQYDQDYKNLAYDLLQAYNKGATTASIAAILVAYTGKTVVVEEMFKNIGKTADISDRNTLRISVRAVDFAPDENTQESIARLQFITSDLYSAIDRAKPAHVGVDLGVAIGPTEPISDYITGRFGITDELRIIAQLVENSVLDDPLYQAPFLTGVHPDTGLASASLVYFSPASGDIGQSVNVYGSGFTGATQVKLDGVFAAFTVLGDGQINLTVPAGAITGPIIITTPNGNITSPVDFEVQSGPLTYLPKPGAVGPSISKVWEIKDENLDTLDLD